MRIFNIIVFASVLFFTSCTSKKEVISDFYLSEQQSLLFQQQVSSLQDIHYFDSIINSMEIEIEIVMNNDSLQSKKTKITAKKSESNTRKTTVKADSTASTTILKEDSLQRFEHKFTYKEHKSKMAYWIFALFSVLVLITLNKLSRRF